MRNRKTHQIFWFFSLIMLFFALPQVTFAGENMLNQLEDESPTALQKPIGPASSTKEWLATPREVTKESILQQKLQAIQAEGWQPELVGLDTLQDFTSKGNDFQYRYHFGEQKYRNSKANEFLSKSMGLTNLEMPVDDFVVGHINDDFDYVDGKKTLSQGLVIFEGTEEKDKWYIYRRDLMSMLITNNRYYSKLFPNNKLAHKITSEYFNYADNRLHYYIDLTMIPNDQGEIETFVELTSLDEKKIRQKVILDYQFAAKIQDNNLPGIYSMGENKGFYITDGTYTYLYTMPPASEGGPANWTVKTPSKNDAQNLLKSLMGYSPRGSVAGVGLEGTANAFKKDAKLSVDGKENGFAFKTQPVDMQLGDSIRMKWKIGMRIESDYPSLTVDKEQYLQFQPQEVTVKGTWEDEYATAGEIYYQVAGQKRKGPIASYQNPMPGKGVHQWMGKIPAADLVLGENKVKIILENNRPPTHRVSKEITIFSSEAIQQKVGIKRSDESEYQASTQIKPNKAAQFAIQNQLVLPATKVGKEEFIVSYPFPKGTSYSANSLKINGQVVPNEKIIATAPALKFYLPDYLADENNMTITFSADLAATVDKADFPLTSQFSVNYLASDLVFDSSSLQIKALLKGKVTFKYQDESGETIAPTAVKSGDVDTPYNPDNQMQLDIKGYEFIKVEGNPAGLFDEKEQTVIFIYDKLGEIELVSVPSSIDFGSIPIHELRKTISVPNDELATKLIVSDMRKHWQAWEMTASVTKELTNNDQVIPRALKYVRQNEQTTEMITLNDQPQRVFIQSDANKNKQLVTVSENWGNSAESEGLKVKFSGDIIPSTTGSYQGIVRWTLKNTID